MSKRTNCILTKLNLAAILKHYSDRFEERGYYYTSKRNRRIANYDYTEKILSLNKLFCLKCMEEIKIGDRFERNMQSNKSFSRYYHRSCYESMFL